MNTEFTVSQAADFLGVTVRTLHHWDAKELLVPETRTWSDYRIYTEEDLARGQRILVYRESGVPLAEIAELLDATGSDERTHLLRQREMLIDRRKGVERMLAAVDALIAEADSGVYTGPVPPRRVREILGPDWDPDYQREAEERWGDTEEWRQGQDAMSKMGEADWKNIREEGDRFARALADAPARRPTWFGGGQRPGRAATRLAVVLVRDHPRPAGDPVRHVPRRCPLPCQLDRRR